MYLITATRPDIAFAIGSCARYMSNPNRSYIKALNQVWQYIRTTKNVGLLYNGKNQPQLQGFIDSD